MIERDRSATGLLTKVAENLWVFDDEPLSVAGMRLPLRMTVIRLASGNLLLHSPTRHSAPLQRELEALGKIRYLVAPSVAHWMFVLAWRNALPSATTVAAPGLSARRPVRRSGLRIDRELPGGAPAEWMHEIDTVIVSAPMFHEAALFHRPSRTLVLVDLVQNIPTGQWPRAARVFANAVGISAPDGRAPVYLRLLVRCGGRAAKRAADRLIAFAPERVVFAHGDWFSADATGRLRRSLQWLTGTTRATTPAPRLPRPTSLKETP